MCFFVIGGWATRFRDLNIESNGTRAIATVTSKQIFQSDGPTYRLQYTFKRAGDMPVQTQRYVAKWFWTAHAVGDTMTVAFDADRPTLSFPLGHGSTSVGLALFASAVGTALTLMGFAVARSAFDDEAPS